MKPKSGATATPRTVLFAGASIPGLSPAMAAEFPLKAADNGRHLVDQKGEPFLVVGDTAWSLIATAQLPGLFLWRLAGSPDEVWECLESIETVLDNEVLAITRL
jgi:hypothetical protein